MRFKKAPLIELIAEFRWNPNGTGQAAQVTAPNAAQVQFAMMADPNYYEQFFARYADRIGGDGYVRTERLVPQGWPFPNQIPVLRFRQANDDNTAPTLYQIGAGLFSAHALPPYQSWDQFKPVIDRGLRVLHSSLSDQDHISKFTSVTLRYIDRFTSELTGDRTPQQFIRDVLGIHLDLPNAITAEADDEKSIDSTLLLRVPLKSELLMTLGINPPTAPPTGGIIMDTSVVTRTSVSSEILDVMSLLETAHGSISRLFMGVTAPIKLDMEPE